MEDGKIYGPYKATKLWNEMVELFRSGIPLKKHRRHIKIYENCFTGQEAANWFQTVLKNNPSVGSSITKEQTIQLLNKFLKAGVFQNVNPSSELQQFLKEGDLYQLTEMSSPRLPFDYISPGSFNSMAGECRADENKIPPGQPFQTQYASASQLKCSQNVHFSSDSKNTGENFKRNGSLGFLKSDTNREIVSGCSENVQVGDVWKQVIISRLENLVPGLGMLFKLELQNIPGEWVLSNGTAAIHHHDSQFPQSLVAAMNCLVHWPQAVPNEILTAFKEHYFKLKEPLTTFKMYSLFTKLYLHMTSSGIVPNGQGLLSLKLPPNSCFETAFTSDSPVTRIVPQRSVDTLHFSHLGRVNKPSFPKRISSAPNLMEQLNFQGNEKTSNRSSLKQQKSGKYGVKMNRRVSRRKRVGMEEDKMYHVRNKSGGYVNPALSQSIDDIDDSVPEQELDYVAALETLNVLMRCSRRESSSNALPVGARESDSQSSESSSYYTAASSSSSAASSRRSSFDLMDSVVKTAEDGHLSLEVTKEKVMISVLQLVLLCIPVDYRIQLRYLLHFMNQWNVHHSLFVQADVVNIFTPTIVRSSLENDYDVNLARSIVSFLVTHHEMLLNVPSDLETEVGQHLSALQFQKVKSENRVTYCEQVSSQQFEQQKLTGSQRALSELLEQILQDTKMPLKEKRKRLKMFKESYPHIYRHRFPDSTMQNKAVKKQPGGFLNLATLSRLKSLRV
ncbi:hypothetical protein L9F63_022673 [Diploptera punctata]|uniref:DEP domain-containing protein n=1 Tax=Diploptera punctata TaxID=6984 RepID=A0AAD8EAC9_DIPPU|nr:hypothetical protein L9F63_022673 [Diploptera punctata]